MSETPPPLPLSPNASRWKVRCGVFTFLLLAAMLFEGRTMFTMVPRFEKLFEEMFGTKDKLPELTRFIISFSRFQQSNVLLFGPLLLLPFVLLWWRRGATWICVVCGGLTLMFLGTAVAAYPAVFIPTAQLINDLTVNGPPLTPEEREQIINDLRSGKSPF